jgi:F-type H+-transporting ATPase subunit alpha
VELLKQGQYQPMPVEEQVAVIWVGTSGYLDQLPLQDVRRFEKEYLDFIKVRYAELLPLIAQKKELLSDVVDMLKKSVEEFSLGFKKSEAV